MFPVSDLNRSDKKQIVRQLVRFARHEESEITTNRIVVIDDPVSSFDCDILFIICCLIKELFKKICENTGLIKQIFVLTHNVYFHKEITFNKKRNNNTILNEETFCIVRKPGLESVIIKQNSNPIKSSYELL